MDVLLRSQSTTALPDRLTQINLYPNTFLPLKCARHLATGYTKEECLGSDFENGRTRTAQLNRDCELVGQYGNLDKSEMPAKNDD